MPHVLHQLDEDRPAAPAGGLPVHAQQGAGGGGPRLVGHVLDAPAARLDPLAERGQRGGRHILFQKLDGHAVRPKSKVR